MIKKSLFILLLINICMHATSPLHQEINKQSTPVKSAQLETQEKLAKTQEKNVLQQESSTDTPKKHAINPAKKFEVALVISVVVSTVVYALIKCIPGED